MPTTHILTLLYFNIMKYLAAYALLVLGGNAEPTGDDVKKVLSEIGSNSEEPKILALLAAVKGKKLHEIISSGLSQVSMQAAVNAPAAEEKKVEKKDEKPKVEEKKEEEIDLGGAMDMFGAMDA